VVRAPAVVVDDQRQLETLYREGRLRRDFVAVVRFQGPRANGMPELHKLTPLLGALQDEGFQVALVTDGRMSGASGKVPAAIHVTPEAACGGMLAKLVDGDVLLVDCERGVLEVEIDDATLAAREPATTDLDANARGYGRGLFGLFRAQVSGAEAGASPLFGPSSA
jgi:phosphogluconate dehydratase